MRLKLNSFKLALASLVLISLNSVAYAEEEKKADEFSVKFGGFVRYDAYFDSRQTTSFREGNFMLYPKNISKITDEKDPRFGKDTNAESLFNMTSFVTRGLVKITTPEVLGAKVNGLIEGDFFGPNDPYVSMFLLRHSYINLAWPNAELLLGQLWSPMFTMDFMPKTVGFSTGTPFNPFARFPQASVTYKPIDFLKFTASATMERDAFSEINSSASVPAAPVPAVSTPAASSNATATSTTVAPVASTAPYGNVKQQRASLPAFHLHGVFLSKPITFGIGGYLKTIKPEVLSESFMAYGGTAYLKSMPFDGFLVQAKAVYGSDMSDHLIPGGFIQDDKKFLPLQMFSSWLDLDYEVIKNLNIGIFGGYLNNLGAAEKVSDTTKVKLYARDPNLSYLFKVVPRVTYTAGKVKFCLEYDFSNALYAKANNYTQTMAPKTEAGDSAVSNHRIQFTTFYNF